MAIVTRTGKDGKPRYDVVVYLPDPVTGRRKQKWFRGFPTKRAAEAKEAELKLSGARGGTWQPAETVGSFLARWLDTEVRRTVAPGTARRYGQLIHLHLIPALGHLRLDQLHPSHLSAFYRKASESGRRDGKAGGLHPRSILHCHRVLHNALATAQKWGLVAHNVCDAVEPPRPPKPRRTALTTEEVARLLEAAREDRLFPLYVAAVNTGMRLGELLGLKWEDLDLGQGVCFVRRSLKKAGREPVFGGVKTHRSERPVALGKETVTVLRRWKAEQNRERLAMGDHYRDYGLVFTLPDGGPLDPCNLTQKRFKALLRKAGLPEHHVFHSLRHTAATLALQAGIPAKTVSDRLGHSTVTLTLDTYTHFVPELQQEAAERIESIVFSKKAKVN